MLSCGAAAISHTLPSHEQLTSSTGSSYTSKVPSLSFKTPKNTWSRIIWLSLDVSLMYADRHYTHFSSTTCRFCPTSDAIHDNSTDE